MTARKNISKCFYNNGIFAFADFSPPPLQCSEEISIIDISPFS
jgi:hypothetical protein